MTPTVADKTSNPAKDWRRHSDPPGLWIGVVIGSVALHLLAFWLLRSYQSSLLWQQQNQSTIPIELVDIPAQPKSTATLKARVKSTSPKPATKTQKLPKQVVPTQKSTAKPAPVTQDESAIALAAQRQRELAAQQQQLAAQQKRELAAQRQREQAAQQQREQAAQQKREQAAQRQREQAAQQQREQAAQQQREQATQQQREQAAQQKREQAAQQKRKQAAQQRENTNNTDNQKPLTPPANAAGGSLIAGLVGEPQQGERDRHTNPAKIKPSKQPFTKGLEYIKYIEKGSGQPVEITAILTISEKGILERVAIADPSLSAEEKTHYEEFVTNEVLKSWEFEPAYDNDPKDPKPSNLTVHIRIQPLP
jgi:chemotaxis protein histidine kinase CheA